MKSDPAPFTNGNIVGQEPPGDPAHHVQSFRLPERPSPQKTSAHFGQARKTIDTNMEMVVARFNPATTGGVSLDSSRRLLCTLNKDAAPQQADFLFQRASALNTLGTRE